MNKNDTTKLVIGIYKLLEEQNPHMLDAYVATMSVAATIAARYGITSEEFIRDCTDCFADGETVSKKGITFN
jgi:hypothetical protein